MLELQIDLLLENLASSVISLATGRYATRWQRRTSPLLLPPFTPCESTTKTWTPMFVLCAPHRSGSPRAVKRCVFFGSGSTLASMGAITNKFDARISLLCEGTLSPLSSATCCTSPRTPLRWTAQNFAFFFTPPPQFPFFLPLLGVFS